MKLMIGIIDKSNCLLYKLAFQYPFGVTHRSFTIEQSAYHRRIPHQGTGWLSTWKVMNKSTVESGSKH